MCWMKLKTSEQDNMITWPQTTWKQLSIHFNAFLLDLFLKLIVHQRNNMVICNVNLTSTHDILYQKQPLVSYWFQMPNKMDFASGIWCNGVALPKTHYISLKQLLILNKPLLLNFMIYMYIIEWKLKITYNWVSFLSCSHAN